MDPVPYPSPCPPARIHLPLGLLLEAFPDSPFHSVFTLRCVCTEGYFYHYAGRELSSKCTRTTLCLLGHSPDLEEPPTLGSWAGLPVYATSGPSGHDSFRHSPQAAWLAGLLSPSPQGAHSLGPLVRDGWQEMACKDSSRNTCL